MVFGYPIVVVLREASVVCEAETIADQIADFLVKNPRTSNATLVELKTRSKLSSQARLIAGTPVSASAPHHALSGAVAQVLDQKFRLQKDIATIVSNNDGFDLKTYHVDCVVVAELTREMPINGNRWRCIETASRTFALLHSTSF